MSIPDGIYIVKSAAFRDRVVDLSNARQLDTLIGFHETRAPNQKWTFINQGNNEYQITTIATSSAGLRAFVRGNVAEGAFIFGGGMRDRNLYTVAKVGDNKFRISPKENSQLAWTLRSEAERDALILHNIDGNINQTWDFIRV